MTRLMSARLEPLRRRAESWEQKAALQLAAARSRLAEREARLDELRRYRDEYALRIGGHSTALLLNARAFWARVGEAERQQQQLVETARRELDAAVHHWRQRHRETGTLEQLADSYRRRENQVAARREQTVSDEQSLQRHRLLTVGRST